MNKRKTGTAYEALAADYLAKQGYRILEMNYRCKLGEIDIIAAENGYLVFTEVKYRTNTAMGTAAEAVDFRKQYIIRRVAGHYMMMKHLPEDTPCRFDVVGITGTKVMLFRDAF